MVSNPFIFIFAPSDGPLRFDGGRGGDPFRKPNSKLPDNKGNRPPLPPGFGGVLLGVLFLVGFALLLGAYRGVENIRPIDIFLMAVMALLLSRLVRGRAMNRNKRNGDWSRGRSGADASSADADREEDDEDEAEAYWRRREEEEMRSQAPDQEDNDSSYAPPGRSEDPWDRYRSWPEHSASMEKAGLEPPSFSKGGPQSFDRHEFITGAKILFEKVQEAVAGGNPDSVQYFLSEQAAAEVEAAMQESPDPQSCSILALDAAIRDILEKGEATTVSVAFNAVIHIGSDDMPREVEAVWRFSRADAQDNWRLDSIHA